MSIPEMTHEQLRAILKQENSVELHKILDDRRRTPFISMEDYEKKWGINQPKSDK